MIKPKDFDEVQAYGQYTPLEVGGHICRIMSVEETKSKAGRDMIVIYIDTDPSDKQPCYFSEQYKIDSREQKRWGIGGTMRQLVYDSDNKTNRGFKTFIDMVEGSNPGFKVQWGDQFTGCLKGKLVGGVFGKEEYKDSYGNNKFSVKLFNFRTVEDIKNGVEVPKDKLLTPGSNSDDLVPVVDDGELPF